MKKILIMGLPGSGKTTFAKELLDGLGKNKISYAWFNADAIRKMLSDWDFSLEGRVRQAQRMTDKANICKTINIVAVCDFVCPTEQLRKLFDADILIWMDTIRESEFEDTNRLFESPSRYDFRIKRYDQYDEVISEVIELI